MKSGDTSGIFFETSSKKTGTTDGTSNARSYEKFSVFGDGSYGEPIIPQHLNLDFTPNDDIDNDFVQRKICSFWKFIENSPEIHNLMAKPTHQMKQLDKIDLNKIDTERSSGEPMRAQHLVIDFTPGREDTPEIQARCQQFWQFANNHPELKGMKVQPTPDLEQQSTGDFPSNKSIPSDSFTQRNNIPAVHMMKKMDKKGVTKAALETGQVNRSYT